MYIVSCLFFYLTCAQENTINGKYSKPRGFYQFTICKINNTQQW